MSASLPVSWSLSSSLSQNRGGPPNYCTILIRHIVLLLVIVVLAPHHLKPTPPSVVIAVIIGASLGAAQHIEEVGGLIHREPLLVQFLDLVAIGWAEGGLAVCLLPPPARLLLLLPLSQRSPQSSSREWQCGRLQLVA